MALPELEKGEGTKPPPSIPKLDLSKLPDLKGIGGLSEEGLRRQEQFAYQQEKYHTIDNEEYAYGYTQPLMEPEAMPNWEKLNWLERTIVNHLPGSDSAFGKALTWFSESPLGKLLEFIDIGAEGLERGIGFIAQAGQAYSDKLIGNEESWNNFKQNLEAAWYAGSFAADVTELPRWDGEKLSWPEDHGAEILVRMRQQIADQMARGIDPGEALVNAKDSYYNDLGALAIRGQLRDAAFHILGDPLNAFLAWLKPIEKAKVFVIKNLAGKAVPEELLAQLNKVDDVIRVAEEAGNTKRVEELTALRKAYETYQIMSPTEQRIMKLMGEIPTTGRWGKILASRWNPFGLTPEARAANMGHDLVNNVMTRIITNDASPEEIMRALQRIADGVVSPELGHIIVSPQGRYVKGIIDGVVAEGEGFMRYWTETTQSRVLLHGIANALGDDPYKIFTRIVDGEQAATLELLLRKAEELPEFGQSLDNLLATMGKTRETFTAEDLLVSMQKFGDAKILDESIFRASLINTIADRATKMAVLKYGVKARGFARKFADMVKSAETLGFLKLNPSYPIRNFMNNEFTMLARGAWGWWKTGWADDFWKAFGMEPTRLRSGFGPAAIKVGVVEGSPADVVGGIISEATTGKKGWVDKITRKFSDTLKGKNAAEIAARMESNASHRAMTAGAKRYRSTYMTIAEMPEELVSVIGRENAEILRKELRGAFTFDDVDNIFYKTDNLNMADGAIRLDADEFFGGDISRVIPEEELEPIVKSVKAAYEKEGPTGAANAAKLAIEEVKNKISSQTAEELEDIIAEMAARIEVGKFDELPNAVSQTIDGFHASHERMSIETARAMDIVRELRKADPVLAHMYIREHFANTGEYFAREFNRVRAGVKGITKGLGDEFPYTDDLITRINQWQDGWKDFFKVRNGEYDKFFSAQLKGKEYAKTFDQISTELNTLYREAVENEQRIRGQLDELMALVYPEGPQRDMFLTWREKIADAVRADRELVIKFRENPLDNGVPLWKLPPEARGNDLWDAHMTERIQQWREISRMSDEGAAAMRGNQAAASAYSAPRPPAPEFGMTDDFARGNYESRWRLLERVEEEADRLGKKAVYNAKGVEEEGFWVTAKKGEFATSVKLSGRTDLEALENSRVAFIDPDDWGDYQLAAARAEAAKRGIDNAESLSKSELEGLGVWQEDVGFILPEQAEWKPIGSFPEEVIAEAPPTGRTVNAIPGYNEIVPERLFSGRGMDQLFALRGEDAINSVRDAVISRGARKPLKLGNLGEQGEDLLRAYVAKAKGHLANERYATVKFGEWMRDSALLNYNRTTNFDTWLQMLMPYEFWTVHSVFNWALHSIDRPMMLATFLRVQKLLETGWRPEKGLPSRVRGKIRLNMPFISDIFGEWLGNEIFVDPLSTALPFKQWSYWAEELNSQSTRDNAVAERVLEGLLNDGKVTQAQYNDAMTNKQGPVWERALVLAQQDDTERRLSPFDFVSMMISPHAPVLWAYNAMRDTPEEIGPFLPITRSIKGITSLFGVGPPGGVNIEASIRRELGLPEFDQWEDYRVDRMITNMIAMGEITQSEARSAMTQRSGPIYDEAKRKAGIQYGITALGSTIGIPAQAYPEGEERLRVAKEMYEEAWKGYEATGDYESTLGEFHRQNPGYEERIALWDTPEERLRRFMVDEIWNLWNEMPTLHKSETVNQLGELFEEAFLNRETRNVDAIPADTLNAWIQIMGGDPPGKVTYNADLTPISLTNPEIAWGMQVFYDTRERMFNYKAVVAPLWNDYFKLDKEARKEFWNLNPILERYVDWRNDFMLRNPDMAPYIEDDPEKRPKYEDIEEMYQALANQPNFTEQEYMAIMGEPLYMLLISGEELPPVARQKLKQLEADYGMNFEQMLTQAPQ